MEENEIFGYRFANPALLEEALTSPACKMDDPSVRDNQRLEFLGDAVLGFLSAEELYGKFLRDSEGSLTVKRSRMVSAASLCEVAERHGVVPRLKRNRHAGRLSPRSKTIADTIEAIIGAAYLDGGMKAARQVYAALELSAKKNVAAWGGNPKGELQIRAQAFNPPRHPVYTLLCRAGKPHEPIFTVKVSVDGVGEASAAASNRHGAETLAAAMLLEKWRKKS